MSGRSFAAPDERQLSSPPAVVSVRVPSVWKRRASERERRLALLLAFVLAAAASVYELRYPRSYLLPEEQSDFSVYFVGSQIVAHGGSRQLYDYIGSVPNPQRVDAPKGSAIAQMARADGLARVRLYVYPPLLADLLLPLTSVPLSAARVVWRVAMLCALLLAAGSLCRLLRLPLRSRGGALVFAAVLCCSPLWQSLHYGQVTPLLFAGWSVAILLYVRGWPRTSAIVLSFGVLLKLTPAIAIVPLLLWRDWRSARWLAGATACGVLLLCVIHSPEAMALYAVHVVPRMSAGVFAIDNFTVDSVIGTAWLRLAHPAEATTLPASLHALQHGLCAGLVAGAAWLTFKAGRETSPLGRGCVLASFALLSLCIAPVAWVDAFLLSSMILVLLWWRTLRYGSSRGALLLLLTATAVVGGSVALQHLPGEGPALVALQYSPVAFSLVLVYLGIREGATDRQHGSEAVELPAVP